VTSFQALQAEPATANGAFQELPRHLYAPTTRVSDVKIHDGRLLACRSQNLPDANSSESAAESRVGFEILSLGSTGARPARVGSLEVGCTRMATAGNLVWLVQHDRDAATGARSYSLSVADLSNEASPRLLATLGPLSTTSEDVRVVAQGQQMFIAFTPTVGAAGDGVRLLSYDFEASPGRIVANAEANAPGRIGIGMGAFSGMAISSDRLYLSQEPGHFLIYRLRGPGRRPDALAMGAGAFGTIDLSGPFGFLMQTVGGVRVIDLR
ncbi:MAG: hypothetical protein HY901_07065, partial [Deltaproteobacteria bacterium]|nr:hypothetical protein [Deltaproteobacteria bacterium]